MEVLIRVNPILGLRDTGACSPLRSTLSQQKHFDHFSKCRSLYSGIPIWNKFQLNVNFQRVTTFWSLFHHGTILLDKPIITFPLGSFSHDNTRNAPTMDVPVQ
jgi:hypothetical protein